MKKILLISILCLPFLLSGCAKSCSFGTDLEDFSFDSMEHSESSSSSDSQATPSESSENQSSSPSKNPSLENTNWTISSVSDKDGNNISVDTVKTYVGDINLKFVDKSKCIVDVAGSSLDCVYSLNGENLSINNGEFTGTLSNKNIALNYDSMKVLLKQN